MVEPDLTPLGRLLESSRQRIGISGREAARRAGISSGRWHQVVTGRQPKAGQLVPVNPRPLTVVAMALAVQVDPATALDAARLDAAPERVTALVEEVQRAQSGVGESTAAGEALAAEIERIRHLPISARARRRMIEALVAVAAEEAAEEQQARSTRPSVG